LRRRHLRIRVNAKPKDDDHSKMELMSNESHVILTPGRSNMAAAFVGIRLYR
jgi:hypothetical protein